MQTIIRIVKSLSSTSSDPIERIFNENAEGLNEAYFALICSSVLNSEEKYKSLMFLRCKNPLPRMVILRILLLWHRLSIEAPNSLCFIRELSLMPSNKNQYSKPLAFDMLIESYREYLNRRAVVQFEDTESWTLKMWIVVSFQLLKLLNCLFKIEILLENEWNKATHELSFAQIGQGLVRDSQRYLKVLYQFVEIFSKLILQDHPETDTINTLYEQILFASRQAQKKLKRINSTNQQIPKLVVDRELNKTIEFHMAERRRKTQNRYTASPSYLCHIQQTDDELHNECSGYRPMRQPYTNQI